MEINSIYNENCLDTMARMPDSFVDLTVTSPPYDNLRVYTGELSWCEDVWRSVIKDLYRVTKPGGVVVWVVGDATIKGSETGTSFRQALYAKECGFNLHDTMIYAKNNYMPLTHNRYEQAFEYMFVFSRGRPVSWNPIKIPTKVPGKKKYRGVSKQAEVTYAERKRDVLTVTKKEKQHPNIFYYSVGDNDKTAHNAPFPEKLTNDQIISWSKEGDLVYDPFLGSGTTAKMAILNNRNCVGSEVSREYCEIALERINKSL